MFVELLHLSSDDLPKIRDWIMENSPSSKLLIGNIVGGNFMEDWHYANMGWDIVDAVTPYYKTYDDMFAWAVDIPDEDAVFFKLVWG